MKPPIHRSTSKLHLIKYENHQAYNAAQSALLSAEVVGKGANAAHAAFQSVVAVDNAFPDSHECSYKDAEFPASRIFFQPLWQGKPAAKDWLYDVTLPADKNQLDTSESWAFWREWYQGFLDGKPMDWELQRRVALIDDAIWEAGPEAVTEEIERIRAVYEREKAASGIASEPKPATENEKSAIAQRVMINRDALAVSISGVLEQLSSFKERVRGLNHLDPDFREELLNFIDTLSAQLDTLLHDLPKPGELVSDETTNRLVLWLREFRPLIREEATRYIAPKNVTEAAIPTAIILGCTGVGSMLGMPLAGAAVGGLITGQIKPGKAVDALMKPSDPDGDGA